MTIEERVTKERAEQGLPPKVTDPAVLDRVALLILGGVQHQAEHPVLTRPRWADDFVYFIRSGQGFIKIGRSRDPQARLKSLASNIPGLELLAVLPNGARETEFHERFAAHRAHGEWFHPALPLLAFLEECKWAAAKKEQLEGSAKPADTTEGGK